ncbi:MAG: hypothetical protein V3U24_06100 [Candidatus Neomarinimicrobiota bacterium]
MNTKKFFLAVVAGFVGNVVAYYVLEQFIFKGYMEKNIIEPTGAAIGGAFYLPLIAVLAMVLIMAYLYPKGYEGGPPAGEGLRFGILLGLFAGIPFGIFFDLMFPIGFGPTVVFIFVYTLEVATAGLLIGFVYGKPGEAAAETPEEPQPEAAA